MNSLEVKRRSIDSIKWTAITEVLAKLIVPITNIILARILVPDAFGVIATITMIISFADMFTDSGFQKYLIQHDFKSDKELKEFSNVAFWGNFLVSLLFVVIIVLFSEKIATLVGNPGLGNVIRVASVQLPLTSFSSIQFALFRRKFDFKKLFYVRIIGVFIPLIVAVPLSLLGFSYWSLIISTITIQLFNAIFMTTISSWKPKMYFSISQFKKMFSFSAWSLVEAISIWLTVWIDTFIIGRFLNDYYLGLYKTSTSMVNSILTIVTSITIPVLFSTLSRLQNNQKEFKKVFFSFFDILSLILIPLGVLMYLNSDIVTLILLGDQWIEGSDLIGLWSITGVFVIIFSNLASEVYRANGKPKISVLAQILHLLVLIPVVYIFAQRSFDSLIISRSLIRVELIIVNGVLMFKFFKISYFSMIKRILPVILSALTMYLFIMLLYKISTTYAYRVIISLIGGGIYISLICLNQEFRNLILNFYKKVKIKIDNILKKEESIK